MKIIRLFGSDLALRVCLLGMALLLLYGSKPLVATLYASGPGAVSGFSAAALQFALFGAVQALFADSYNLQLAGFASKSVLLYALYLVCREVLAQARMPRWLMVPAFAAGLLLVARLPYLAALQSFDPAQTLMLALLAGVAAYLIDRRWRSMALTAALLVAACAAPQYVYLPMLALFALWLTSRLAAMPFPLHWVKPLLLLQLLVALPLLLAPFHDSHANGAVIGIFGVKPAVIAGQLNGASGLLLRSQGHLQQALDAYRPLCLFLGVLVPLSLLYRRIYLRLVAAVSFLALFGVAQLLWGAASSQPVSTAFGFTVDLLLMLELFWIGCLVWELQRYYELQTWSGVLRRVRGWLPAPASPEQGVRPADPAWTMSGDSTPSGLRH
ncbi:hypothetical protein [Chitinimonas sp.]|uniref:hypothetical protein n=1 Tax=Chitinimonas sp. TaxID=1934313 RepID=UPI0035B1A7D1